MQPLAVTDRLHGDSDLELGAVRAAFGHRWETSQGWYPASQVDDGPCLEKRQPQPLGAREALHLAISYKIITKARRKPSIPSQA